MAFKSKVVLEIGMRNKSHPDGKIISKNDIFKIFMHN